MTVDSVSRAESVAKWDESVQSTALGPILSVSVDRESDIRTLATSSVSLVAVLSRDMRV